MSPPMITPRTSTPAGAGQRMCCTVSSAPITASVAGVEDERHDVRRGVTAVAVAATVIVPPVESPLLS